MLRKSLVVSLVAFGIFMMGASSSEAISLKDFKFWKGNPITSVKSSLAARVNLTSARLNLGRFLNRQPNTRILPAPTKPVQTFAPTTWEQNPYVRGVLQQVRDGKMSARAAGMALFD